MKVSINAINQHFKKPLSTEDIVSALEKTEVEIEEIIRAHKLDKKIVTAKVLKVIDHPNSDRLHLADVEFGKGKKITIVCGAPNLAENMVVALAQVGSVLPSGDKIAKVKIRGVESRGMLCSEKELALSDDHSGIAVLDPSLPLGISLCDIELFSDIIDIKTPTNRWDMLSIEGLAREIFSNNNSCVLVNMPTKEIKFEDREIVQVIDKQACKRFISIKLKIDNKVKSPSWLVDNLRAAGMRSINAAVDITNYVMLETGQPSHVYDSAKLSGSLKVRSAKKDERLTTLDSIDRVLSKEDLVIADNSGALGLAGIMGGAKTEISMDTTEVILEVANFDKTLVRKSAMRQKIRTEASARFEKGLPLPLCELAAKRLLYLFEDICNAKIINNDANDQIYAWPWIQHVGVRIRNAEKFLGVKLDEKEVISGLKRRGFEAEHFSIVKEARKHLGKPYKWGANFKQDGSDAFDCSYLIDYIYSLIGVYVGHTALAQYEHGESIEIKDLRPGDVVFYEGKIEKSVTDHYYIKDNNGQHRKKTLSQEKKVGHNGIYLGNHQVIMAAEYEYKNKKWVKRKNKGVIIVQLKEFINNPSYLGARRYVKNFNHIIAVTAPWWRNDIRIEQDMYEEIAKIVGYDNLPATLPQLPPTSTVNHQIVLQIQNLKDLLIDRGLFEVMTYSFVSQKHLELGSSDKDKHLKIINPLSKEQEYLRSSLLVSHINCVSKNSNYHQQQYGFFETSRVYTKSSSKEYKKEHWLLAITMVGKDSLERLKSYLDTLDVKYNWNINYSLIQNNSMINSRTAGIKIGKQVKGLYGQISPSVLNQLKINEEVSFAEISIDTDLLNYKQSVLRQVPLYQLIDRDITLELSDKAWWQDIKQTLQGIEKVINVDFISEFSNDSLQEKSKKRISFKVVLDCGPQPESQEIDTAISNIIQKLEMSDKIGKIKVC